MDVAGLPLQAIQSYLACVDVPVEKRAASSRSVIDHLICATNEITELKSQHCIMKEEMQQLVTQNKDLKACNENLTEQFLQLKDQMTQQCSKFERQLTGLIRNDCKVNVC